MSKVFDPSQAYLWILCLMLLMAGCGQQPTEIMESSVALNTVDTQGPYQIQAVIRGDYKPFDVQLIYSVDEWKTRRSVEMTPVEANTFRGSIPGQAAGSVVNYFIQVTDSTEARLTEPLQLPSNLQGKTYSFSILPKSQTQP
ncbi:MAG: hypothetical protein AAGJ35_04170 [Myxococcota bacterium]